MRLFKDWGVTNIDLRKKVARKISRKNKLKKRSESADYTGRKYDDYVEFVKDKLDLMFSHINSVPRKSLGGKTPYEAFEFFYGKDTLDKFNIQKIKEDEVTLQPYFFHLYYKQKMFLYSCYNIKT